MFERIFGQEKHVEYFSGLVRDSRADGSFLLTGPAGVGKWAYGLYFAAIYFCESKDTVPCGQCNSCRAIETFKHPDVQFLFPFPNLEASKKQVTIFPFSDPNSGAKYSKATYEEVQRFIEEKSEDPFRMVRFEGKPNIPVDILRDLRKFLRLRPMWGGNRAILISDIEKMAPRCTDLFLKTIEEPPSNSLIVLTSSVPERLPATILSRCRNLSLGTPEEEDVLNYLKEFTGGKKADLRFIVRASRNSPGLARLLMEEKAVEMRDKILGIINSSVKRDGYLDSIITNFRPEFPIASGGVDAANLLIWILRDVIILQNSGNIDDIINCDRAELISGLTKHGTTRRIEDFINEINSIKLATDLSNVLPVTAFRHLLSLIKKNFSKAS
ncbi:MAG: hypothetical protein GF315_12985 [candidate division Zixibacteria bacterium]|nr:hypothetical protein [candidate division Zixibacteria bacterium]